MTLDDSDKQWLRAEFGSVHRRFDDHIRYHGQQRKGVARYVPQIISAILGGLAGLVSSIAAFAGR